MKAVLLGSKGQLGHDILSAHARLGTLEIQALTRDQLDVSDLAKVREVISGLDFDVLVNCTSYHKTDEVESNAQQAVLINSHLVRDLATISAKKKARFVTISTDYVFGGQAKREPLTEADPTAPVNVYGATKVLGESLASSAHRDTMVLRVSSLFGVAGASGKGGNFVETMLRLAKQNGSLKVVNDQVMAPTATADIAEALLRLLAVDAPGGLYHVAGSGHASWWDFARRIVERSGIDVPVQAVPTTEFPTPAMRPPYSVLSSGKLASITGWAMPPWEHALDRYLIAKGHRG
jgi:dTDP-4-dehydrorhamnose reductase